MDLNKVLYVMEKAAVKAGRMLERLQPKSRRLKSRKDFLTDADIKAEKIILNTLTAEYRQIPQFSEEKGGIGSKKGYLWIIDPVDGTVNFFLQDDNWGISIALVKDGLTVAGLIYLPAKRQIFRALRGKPAKFRQIRDKNAKWKDISVGQEKYPSNSQFWIEWGKEEHGGDDHKRVYKLIEKLDHHSIYPQIRNSTIADMMVVACGKISGLVFLKPEPFDIAAAGLIIECAGGKVTDINGNKWSPFSLSMVASNGVLHRDLLRIINSKQ